MLALDKGIFGYTVPIIPKFLLCGYALVHANISEIEGWVLV